MSNAIKSKRTGRRVTMLLGALGTLGQGAQADNLVIPLELPQPNFIGFGVGPDPGSPRIE